MINKKSARAMVAVATLIVAAMMVGATSSRAANPSAAVLMSIGSRALQTWDYREAGRVKDELARLAESGDETAKSIDASYRADYGFYTGDYASGRDAMNELAALRELSDYEKSFRDRLAGLAETWDGAVEARSDHFRLRYKPGRDEVLVEPALSTLEKAYAALTSDLGVAPADPVLAEVYPSFESFANSTGLTMEELEDSGTIAICKYRRLMINTPRRTRQGYSYRDTLSHEFVHFLIYQKYGPDIPIWLHEGLAKYEELRWRKDEGGELTPTQKSLLASALRQDELITFERMHPSFAKFKTPSQGQLAFAEVTTVVDYLVKTGGWERVFALCDSISQTNDYRSSLEKVTGKPFDKFWNDWIKHAKGLGFQELPGMEITAFEIMKGEKGLEDEEEIGDEGVAEEDLASGDEWRYARIGDLLRDRGHYRAAGVEYGKARELAPYSIRILNKQGICYTLAEDYEAALEPLETAIELAPGYGSSYVNLGRALYKLGRYAEAEEVFARALDINPFNPIPYGPLLDINMKAGREDRTEKLKRDLVLISS